MKISDWKWASLVLVAGIQTAAAADMVKVNIGYPPAVDYLPTFVAQENGCLASKGIDANFTIIPVSTNIPPALIANTLQIGASTATTLLPAVENGIDLVAISGSSRIKRGNEGLSLVTALDFSPAGAADFKGRKVGVPGIMSVADLVFRKWLKDKGVDPTSVSLVEVPFPRMLEMMKTKNVDAVIATEPARTGIVKSEAGKRTPFEYHTEVDADSLLAFWIAAGPWAKANAKVVEDFKGCIASSIGWIRDNPEKSVEIGTKYLKVMTGYRPDWTAEIAPSDFAFYAKVSKEFGLTTKDIDLEKLVFKAKK